MLEATHEEFERAPVGKYTCTSSAVVWVFSPALTGWHIWGRPDEAETRTILRLTSAYTKMGSSFDVVADSRGIEVVNPTALPLLVAWVFQHHRELKLRIGVQANVIRRDAIGFLLMGIIASLGDMWPFETFTDPIEAFRSIAGPAGAALCDEVETIVGRVRSTPRELQLLRTLLTQRSDHSIRTAARELSTSSRSLQRILSRYGTSFHDEQTTARFELAKQLLDASDEKVEAVASRVGWSVRTLTVVFRAKLGMTPAAWRKRESAVRFATE